MSATPANFTEEGDTLRFTGDLTLPTLGEVPRRLEHLPRAPRTVDLSGIGRIDTVGAWVVRRLERDHQVAIEGADDTARRLIEKVSEVDQPAPVRPAGAHGLAAVLDHVGAATAVSLHTLVGLLGFFGGIVLAVWQVVLNPRRFRTNAVVRQIEVVGIDALGIIGLMSFLIGIVIAQQGAVQLRQFGAEVFTVNLIGRLTMRELGVLMTAIMVAGRSGSAFAAQIGSMRLAEEVDAMRTMGLSPMQVLVLPRVIATLVAMPLLSFYAMLVALVGGGLLCWLQLGIPPVTFVARIREVVPMTDLWGGLIKAPVFGMIIAMAGCFQGMQVEGNAEEVGLRTTSAVVQSIFLVIVLDAFFAVFFTMIGWI
ncbi:ABC transporter permease [Sphingomonas morindae]|uniref:MlaE family lipid ABC transporter permease subunit n=1 Tax=Sphingomonas morindae TaxID=1541170 RepID=A0ABY4XB75_9SPHN|nr:MlaE family lipid ABC transporter permease subunit [Sphingomonas morindae]USI74089.1 MlaE family lipid ABC transporter permease subunit [Sphingomonas morindae]